MKSLMWATVLIVATAWLCVPSNAMPQQDAKTLGQPYYIWPRSGAQHVSLDGD